MESRNFDNHPKLKIVVLLDFIKIQLMIKEQEMRKLDLQAGHTQVKRSSTLGKQGNRFTGSIIRECITTITRI